MARQKDMKPMVNSVYDLMLWIFSILVDLFFREVHPRGSWKIPRRGPIIFVAAPHANQVRAELQLRDTSESMLLTSSQFVDPLILMRVIKTEAGRRISWLIAEKSMKRKFIGGAASLLGPVPVGRALDSTRSGSGKIYLPDPASQPLLVRGNGTRFDKEAEVGGLLVLPTVNGDAASAEILEVISPEEIRLKKDFKGTVALRQLTGRRDVDEPESLLSDGTCKEQNGFEGSSYKTAPKVDQTQVYDAVFERLSAGGCIGIFPEGGSHDRTELLPLKGKILNLCLLFLRLICNSGCGHYGFGFFGCKSRFWAKNNPMWYELLPRS